MPELILKLGDSVLQTFVFDKDIMSIGRSRDNDIVVENLSVSRNHARIRRQEGKYVLTDLNSANGTFVNGVRVTKTEIVDEDMITVGKHKLHFANKVLSDEEMIVDAFGADRTMMVDRTPVPMLCVTEGKAKGKEFPLTKFETSIGKAPSNDIVIGDDWFLSKKQAVIVRKANNEFEIQDMGGFRKTKVNGNPVLEPRILKTGDVVELGNTKCMFQVGGDAMQPSGRIPQEMGLEDSIFSSGIEYPQGEPVPSSANGAGAQGTEPDEVFAVEAPPDSPTPMPATVLTPNAASAPEEEIIIGEASNADLIMPREHLSSRSEPTRKSPLTQEQEESERPSHLNKRKRRERSRGGASAGADRQPQREEGGAAQDAKADEVSVEEQAMTAPKSAEKAEAPPAPEQMAPGAIVSSPEAPPDLDEQTLKEVAMWEAALQNKSPVIRRQAARILKKLTGKEYAI